MSHNLCLLTNRLLLITKILLLYQVCTDTLGHFIGFLSCYFSPKKQSMNEFTTIKREATLWMHAIPPRMCCCRPKFPHVSTSEKKMTVLMASICSQQTLRKHRKKIYTCNTNRKGLKLSHTQIYTNLWNTHMNNYCFGPIIFDQNSWSSNLSKPQPIVSCL